MEFSRRFAVVNSDHNCVTVRMSTTVHVLCNEKKKKNSLHMIYKKEKKKKTAQDHEKCFYKTRKLFNCSFHVAVKYKYLMNFIWFILHVYLKSSLLMISRVRLRTSVRHSDVFSS